MLNPPVKYSCLQRPHADLAFRAVVSSVYAGQLQEVSRAGQDLAQGLDLAPLSCQ